MADSLLRIQECPKEIAIVKLVDRITNLQAPPSHWTSKKIQKYLEEVRLIASTLRGRCSYPDERTQNMLRENEENITMFPQLQITDYCLIFPARIYKSTDHNII